MGSARSGKGDIKLSDEFKIAETESFQKNIHKEPIRSLYSKITDYVYPQLRQNPFFGQNIKKLKGEFSSFYRYRIGNFRLFYSIDTAESLVIIVSLKDRKNAY